MTRRGLRRSSGEGKDDGATNVWEYVCARIEIFPRRGYRMAVDFAEARRVFCTPGLRLGHGMLYNSQLTTRRHHMVCTVTTSHGYRYVLNL